MATTGINRNEWEFEYSAAEVAAGAQKQKEFRESRVAWWTEQFEAIKKEAQETGLEIVETVASRSRGVSTQSMRMSEYRPSHSGSPRIEVRQDLQDKLSECHEKIEHHREMIAQYDGWVQFLSAQPQSRIKLTQNDWLFFFRTR